MDAGLFWEVIIYVLDKKLTTFVGNLLWTEDHRKLRLDNEMSSCSLLLYRHTIADYQ